MKKKIFILLLLIVTVISFTGCDSKKKEKEEKVDGDNIKFKEEYEKLNGTKNDSGKTIRTIEIPENNPFIYKSAKDIVNMIDDEETFIVYFGFASCPWCRSVVPTLIQVAKDNNIDKIYYVDVKNIRDVLEVKDGKVVTKTKGLTAYYDLLERLDSVLSDYSLKDEDGEDIETNEKRIYAPNVVAIVNGKAKKLTTGISEDETDPYMELTDEILDDTYKQFEEVIKELDSNDNACKIDSKC